MADSGGAMSVDLSGFIGCVADICEIKRCSQPAALRYCGVSMCERHWVEECVRSDAVEALEIVPEPKPAPEPDSGFGFFQNSEKST